MEHILKGVGTALITPFDENNKVDFKGLKALIDFVSNNGTDYLVVNGTTGESATTTLEEKAQILAFVKENNSKTSYSSAFEVLDFEIEKQFVNPDISRLTQLATNTNGRLFYPAQVDQLIAELLKKESFPAVQKEIIKKSPLIDWIWLLILVAITLTTEWFVRKYNGML